MKTILKNKWHLHSLILVFVIFITWYSDTHPLWFDGKNVGVVFRGIAITFASLCIAFTVEAIQGRVFGANKGIEGEKIRRGDILATTVVAGVGAILANFLNPIWFASISLLIIGGLQLYKIKYLKK